MKTRDVLLLAAIGQLILGCEFSPLQIGSSQSPTKAPPLIVEAITLLALGSGSTADIIWETADSDETVEIEVSDNGTDWTSIGSVPANDQIYSILTDDILVPDGLYELRLKTSSQSFDLGTVTIDRMPPTAGDDQPVFSCDTTRAFVLNAGSDTMGPVTYQVVSGPPIGTLTGCLDGTNSTACSYQGSSIGDAFTITYRVVDQTGNLSPIVTIEYEHFLCS